MTYYKLEYHDNTATGVWIEITSSSSAKVHAFTYTVTTNFKAIIDQTPFYVKFRVSGRNGVGTGIPSDELLVETDTYPLVMTPVTIADPEPNSIVISWTKHDDIDLNTGRDPIIHYSVMWNKIASPLTEVWVELATYPNMASSLTVTSGFLINTSYRVKIAA
jgi:hypothetical protein